MANTNSNLKPPLLLKEQNQANPSKYYTHFLYKSLMLIIFLVIIPVFPSQAPEFINRTLLNRSWELLHLLFVGIAVSYGLFSRRNDETGKENNNKVDNVQFLVSRFLQVSPVFDDEGENLSGSDEIKVQTWSNRCYRNENPVFVATEQVGFDEQRISCSRFVEKPLLLPVRSLKSPVLEANNFDIGRKSSSHSNYKRLNKVKNGEFRGFDEDVLDKKVNEDNVVLPSPIPWRSRSARMEVKDDFESELNRVGSRPLRSETSRLSRSNSLSSSPKKLSSMEVQPKSAEDNLARKKNIYRSPPPPPPPPPPSMIYKSSSPKPSSTDDEISPKQRKDGEIENSINRKAVSFEFPREEKQELVHKLMVEITDDDSESEDDEEDESNNEEANQSSAVDGGSDVDKKADEFIAKVREQIRLQRIDSIKRSSAQIKRNNSR